MTPELYQCQYEKATKCAMDEPCLGCETHAAYFKEINTGVKWESSSPPSIDDFKKVAKEIQRKGHLPPKRHNLDPCPICGSSYFGSHEKDGELIYYCKGHHKMPHNEYTGCNHTWKDGEK